MNNIAAQTTLSELADINPKTSLPAAGIVSFIGMEDVSESFELLNSTARSVSDCGGYTRFEDGDLLFAKITPCMENGKGAEAKGLISGVGFGANIQPFGHEPVLVFDEALLESFRQLAQRVALLTVGRL